MIILHLSFSVPLGLRVEIQERKRKEKISTKEKDGRGPFVIHQ